MKKQLAMLLTVAMGLTLLTGCGSDDGKSSSVSVEESGPAAENTEQGSVQESEEPDDTGSTESTNGEKSLADYEKETRLNLFMGDPGITDEEFNAYPMAKIIAEATGYDITYTLSPSTEAETARSNIFMLKEDYQLVSVSKTEFFTLMSLGALKPITEYVEASSYLKDALTEDAWAAARGNDGEIYGVPGYQPKNCSTSGLAFRLDWLNEYNEANPDSEILVPAEDNGYSMCLSDFDKMLEYFATKVPSDGYAMSIDNSLTQIPAILPAFGVYQSWAEVDGKLTYSIEQPGFQDYAKYMDNLHDSGLAYYQRSAQDTNTITMLQSGRSGVGLAYHWQAYPIETQLADNMPEEGTVLDTYTNDAIGYIAALVPDDCKGDASKVRVFSEQYASSYYVVPAHSTDAQAAGAVDFVDKKLEPELFRRLTIGVEGETFEIREGEYYPILPAFNDEMQLADQFMTGTRMEDYSKYWLARTRKTEAQNKIFSTINCNVDSTGIKNPVTMMPPNEVYDNSWTALDTAVFDSLVLNLYNDGEFDLETVLSAWKANNGDEVTAAVNEWYSTWESKDAFNTVKPR